MTNNTPDTQLEISIHAPREGCDAARQCLGALAGISIHAPREGCDFTATEPPGGTVGFQSTHPVRGATLSRRGWFRMLFYFNPRTP